MDIDCVVIGVNAAATLEGCLKSVMRSSYRDGVVRLIYVDGGSTDQSLEIAGGMDGVESLPLRPEHPAPGLQRNAGWRAGSAPLVMFLDSDTELDPDFLAQAAAYLADPAHSSVAAVFGTRREKHPDVSVFNWIGDLEWNPQPGPVEAFGGDVLVRREALDAVKGYDEELVGGEDPEVSVRLRQSGHAIMHLEIPMTRHDLKMTGPRQYWKRAFRTGYGFAAVSARHVGHARGFWLHEVGRIVARGGGFTALILLALAWRGIFGGACLVVGCCLLLYPRLFRVGHFMRNKSLSEDEAKRYAWHCSLVVLPQLAGIMRYLFGRAAGVPLRNRAPRPRVGRPGTLLLALLLLLGSCAPQISPRPPAETASDNATITFDVKARTLSEFASADLVAQFSSDIPDIYLLGPGDILNLDVWQRPRISDSDLVVSPDGSITVMRIGLVHVQGRSIQEVTEEISTRLSIFYDNPEVRLSVKRFNNNKAFVLGRVANPGLVEFSGKGTLLEALSLAGGLPTQSKDSFLTRCAIIRGKNQVVWVDLRDLLQNGNMALNARIRNNDIIYIPESEDELVYVMGEVRSPGIIRLKSKLTYLDALMMAGGPTKGADLEKTWIIRFEKGKDAYRQVNLKQMLETSDGAANYVLKDNDVLYVGERGIERFNYALRQLLPTLEVLNLGTSIMERFGVMQDIRRRLYRTEGFVDGN